MQLSPTMLIALLVAPTGCALIADLPDVELAPEGPSSSSVSSATAGSGGSGTDYASIILSDGPLAYWRLGEPGGNQAIDASGNEHHGTYQGSPYLGAPGAIAGDTAVRFGQLAHVDAGDIFPFQDNAPFTMEAWFQPDAAMSMVIGGRLFYDEGLEQQQGYAIVVDPSHADMDVTAFRTNGDPAAITGWIGGGAIELGTFYHVAVIYDGSLISLFLNGEKLSQSNPAHAPIGSYPYPFKIASAANWVSFEGAIDEFAVYGSALSGDRILAHYQAGVESNAP